MVFKFKKMKKLRHLNNSHIGKRWFIVGAGPSLNKTNPGLLKGKANDWFNVYKNWKKLF